MRTDEIVTQDGREAMSPMGKALAAELTAKARESLTARAVAQLLCDHVQRSVGVKIDQRLELDECSATLRELCMAAARNAVFMVESDPS